MNMDPEEDEDELEYYVTFPAAVSPEFNEDTYGESEREPVVFLFGWAGCEDRHLSKYAEMYKDLGCVTIRYISPTNYIFFTPRELLDVSDQLIDLITDLTLEVHPVLFHCFSNGGALVYRCLTRRLRERRLSLDVRGAVFDSGPIRRRVTSGWRAIHQCTKGAAWYRWFLACLFVLLVLCRYLWWCTLGSADTDTHPWSLLECPDRWPQLFIYSDKDDITPAQDVDQFMAGRRARGVEVSSRRFADSPHVQHYRYHREEYCAAVSAFLGRVCGPGSAGSRPRSGSGSGSPRRRRPGSGDERSWSPSKAPLLTSGSQ
ncbi:transmembrane protein 53-like [Amphibalanus amphitrite]|uniref:transmembrane protein 53-like n=1 Tax=Amphibalanus amphitrite TaxID=1232801 RepID=UPI001C90F8AF|nr:transmembrane protein 53-like [Amphibalanus amphitrite]XP_043195492.1 transmembrane protein 53-like [Amphibalanus amphitrite]XP_043195493.1 transmembrane protein 53-like [Amphibalanus amphitrite]